MNQVVVAFHPTTTTTTTVLRNGQDRIPHIQRCTTPSAILLKFHTPPPSPKMRSFTRLYESMVNGEDDDDDTTTTKNEIVARRIIVQGDVQGGYYRSCVLNEVCSMYFCLIYLLEREGVCVCSHPLQNIIAHHRRSLFIGSDTSSSSSSSYRQWTNPTYRRGNSVVW